MQIKTEGDIIETKSKASVNIPVKIASGSSASGSSVGESIKEGESNKKRLVTAADMADPSANEHLAIRSKLDYERVHAWQLLLPTRPQNEEHMSAWLMRVVAASDTARPISEVLFNLVLVPIRGLDTKPTAVPMTRSRRRYQWVFE
jgi:hypothetical protein